jgi:hypothetical protein
MAGSIKYFVYTDDRGNDWAILRDESLTEVINGGTQDYADATPGTIVYKVPPNLRPRTLRYVSADGLVSRRIVALTSTIYAGAQVAVPSFVDTVSGKTLAFREQIGERLITPFAADTGLTDGDAT